MAVDAGSLMTSVGDFFNVAGTVLGVMMGMGLIVFLAYVLWKESQFKIPVIIHKVVDGGGIVEYTDKARKITKGGQNELRLRKFKEFIANPPADFYLRTKKGEKLYFRWDGGHIFVPQKVTYNSPLEFQPATYNILNQMSWRIRKAAERHKHKNFWDMYGNIIVWMVVVVMSGVVMIVMFSKLEQVGNGLNAIAGSVAQLAESMRAVQVVS